MARDLSSAVTAEIGKQQLTPIFLFKGIFDSGNLTFWTGIGPLTWGGDTYTGSGDLIKVSDMEETTETRAVNVTFSLSGLPPAVVSVALNENYQQRPIKCWIAFLDAAGTVVADPYLIHNGRADVMQIDTGGDAATIKLSSESVLVALQRAKYRDYSDQDQQAVYPDDTFFSRVAQLQDLEIVLE